jgi:hypothetical protein
MTGWDAQLEDVNKEIVELEDRISTLRKELDVAQWAADAARVQRILAVRELHLERLKFQARFIEQKIALGRRGTKPITYSELALICFNAAKRVARGDAAKRLEALGSTFAAKAFDARVAREHRPQPALGPASREPTHRTGPESSRITLSGQKRAAI